MVKPNSTLKQVNQNLYELEFFTQDPKLKKARKSVRRIARHKERERRRKDLKASNDSYVVLLNDIEFRTTGVQNEEDAISKVSNFKPFRDLVAKLKKSGKEINIVAKKVE
ncbi:hypothetical protein [Desulfuribacillus alkaliarsenatis]|uniref:Uncharacterized protein n=1 Tax=Desulfuribacillus alkaliarsenatis TaxID=766136 RepID=A0A1E5G0W5_9FIRM|nr:hypothetical protein [Desulfuribacillus alkaliarsenatis]OEF96546.1 hypothetical protein BHF68_07815 [Desulfuribacillus alkaliarsenatis]